MVENNEAFTFYERIGHNPIWLYESYFCSEKQSFNKVATVSENTAQTADR